MGILVLVVLVVAGYFAWGRLEQLEREIRREIESVVPGGSESVSAAEDLSSGAPEPLEIRIQKQLRNVPGMLQTDLYECFADLDKRALQKCLVAMERSGKLQRRRTKGTYSLSLP